jgi:hypothetical protein
MHYKHVNNIIIITMFHTSDMKMNDWAHSPAHLFEVVVLIAGCGVL